MKTNPVGWFEIYVQDMERAKAFYEAVCKASSSVCQVLTRKCWKRGLSDVGRGLRRGRAHGTKMEFSSGGSGHAGLLQNVKTVRGGCPCC